MSYGHQRLYGTPWVATPLTLPSRPSLPKAWPTIPPHFVPASILQASRYLRTAWCSFSFGSFGRSYENKVLEYVRSDILSCIIHPSPCGEFRIVSDQIPTAPWEPVLFYGDLTTSPQPSCASHNWPKGLLCLYLCFVSVFVLVCKVANNLLLLLTFAFSTVKKNKKK